MTTVYSKSGLSFFPTKEERMQLTKRLPAGNYTVKIDPNRGPYFEQIAAFDMPRKLYGETVKLSARIINTFLDRPATTGVLLAGEKGSGKTLLAKQLAIDCAVLDIPCVVISQPMVGEGFNSLLQGIEQPCMIFFDEFEKVYNEDEQQQQLLTLMDGTFTSKKLFVLTVNDQYKVNQHMKNRPGRLFYSLSYEGISPEFITEYCADNLKNGAHVEGVRQVATMFYRFNFDMLKAIVEEMNRYDETAQQAMKMLNAKPAADDSATLYDLALSHNGVPLRDVMIHPSVYRGNPLAAVQIQVQFTKKNAVLEKELEEIGGIANADAYDMDRAARTAKTKSQKLTFLSTDLKHVDTATGTMSYTRDGYTVTFTKMPDRMSGYDFYSTF